MFTTLNIVLEDKVMDHYGDVHICGSLMSTSTHKEDYTDMPKLVPIDDFETLLLIRNDLQDHGYGLYVCKFADIEAVLFINCFDRHDIHYAQAAVCRKDDSKSINIFKDAAAHPNNYTLGMSSVWRKCK